MTQGATKGTLRRVVTAAVLATSGLLSVVASPLAGAATHPGTPGAPRPAAGRPTDPVIIVLRDQEPRLPATPRLERRRAAAFAVLQRPLLADLAAARATHVLAYRLVDAVEATVSPGEARRLAADPAVLQVVPDRYVRLSQPAVVAPPPPVLPTGAPVVPPARACPSHPQLNPQADETVKAVSFNPRAPTAASLGYTGAGVRVGFLADGLDINNPEFVRPDGQHVFVDYRDFSGSGTSAPTGGAEAFMDAGSIAAQGRRVYNVAHYTDLPSATPCPIRIEGVAPGVSLVGLDVIGNQGGAPDGVIVQAIDWAVTHDHVNVLNESFGGNPIPDQPGLDVVALADEAAVAAGVTVVASSGDSGVTNTISSPADAPGVLDVGASTTYRLDAQDGYGGARFPGVTGWLDNNVSSLSSGGVTQAGRTVDLVAPGELNWLPCSTDVAMYNECVDLAGRPAAVQQGGGTSESAPITAGVAALVIQAYRQTHGGATPAPGVVAQILTSTANPIDAPADQQGAGLLDAYRAVLAARSYQRPPAQAAGSTTLTSPPQLDVSGLPATPESLTETVTNNAAVPQTISAATQQIGAYTTVDQTRVVLSDRTSGHALDWQGVEDNVEEVPFSVPAGQDRLSASVAFAAPVQLLDARVRLTLIDPAGRLAAYSVPQGAGGYGNVQVARPLAGRWRAYIYSRDSADGGTTGPVLFRAAVARWQPFGTVDPPTLALQPGQSGTFTVEASTAATPGDQTASLVLRAAAGTSPVQTTSVPVVVRTLVPPGSVSFPGTLTGGNGRDTLLSQMDTYQVDVAAGAPQLNVSVALAHDPGDVYEVSLIGPDGQAQAVGANGTTGQNLLAGLVAVPSTSAETHVLDPAAGRWTVVIAFASPVSGAEVTEPFTVSVDENAVPSSAAGVPDGAGTTLAAGAAVQASVTVTNTGPAPETYFLDARLARQVDLPLVSLTGPPVVDVPGTSAVPYLVPPDTTSLAWTAVSKDRITAEAGALGDPNLLGATVGTTARGSFTAASVSPGLWLVVPQLLGPDGSRPVRHVAAFTALHAVTAAFDPGVSTSTGDFWRYAVDPLTVLYPVTVQPGQTVQLPFTITPDAPVGTTVAGTVYVDDLDVADGIGAGTVAAVPYRYTVGPAGS